MTTYCKLALCPLFSISSSVTYAQTITSSNILSEGLLVIQNPNPLVLAVSGSEGFIDSGSSNVLLSRHMVEFDVSGLPDGGTTLDFSGASFSSTNDGSLASAMVQIFGYVANGQATAVNQDGSFDTSEFFGGTSLATITVDPSGSQEFSIPVSDFINGLRAANEQFAGFRFQLLTADRTGWVGSPLLTTTIFLALGDTSGDGVVNFLDISPFISALSTGDYLDEADVNQDGVVNFLDIGPFIAILSGQ